MTDLNYHKKEQPKQMQPEEIAVAILAMVIWAFIAFGIGAAL